MKKLITLVFSLSLGMIALSQSNDISRWSFTIEGGINKFDGDVPQKLNDIFPTSKSQFSFGTTMEYALTPIWGVGIDYYHLPLSGANSALSFNTKLNATDLNATVNLTRWIYPKLRSKFDVNGSVGLGFAHNRYNVKPSNLGYPEKTKITGSIPVTLSCEYNLNKSLAAGIKAHYRVNTSDALEGAPSLTWKGVVNDNVAAATLYLRYKIQAVKKNHLRNMSMDYYDPDEGLVYAKLLKNDIDSLKNKVDSLEERLGTLESDLANLGKRMSNNDSMIVQSSLKNQPRATKTPLQKEEELKFDSISVGSIYFNSNDFSLDKTAVITVTSVVTKMNQNPSLKVKIEGYCDDTGNTPYNMKLSQLRADQTKEKLVKDWDISADRIVSVGKGKVLNSPRKMSYRPNRRCDFYFSK